MKSLLHKPLSFFSKPHGLVFTGLMALLLLAAGCQTTDSNANKDKDVDTAIAIIYGKVTTPDGSGTRAKVRVYNSITGCDEVFDSGVTDYQVTNKAGNYRIDFHITAPYTDKCPMATVELPDSGHLMSPEPQQFKADFRVHAPYDSVRVDFVLKEDSSK